MSSPVALPTSHSNIVDSNQTICTEDAIPVSADPFCTSSCTPSQVAFHSSQLCQTLFRPDSFFIIIMKTFAAKFLLLESVELVAKIEVFHFANSNDLKIVEVSTIVDPK